MVDAPMPMCAMPKGWAIAEMWALCSWARRRSMASLSSSW